MTTDLYSTVFWDQGYGITPDNLNDMQRLVRAQMTDQVLQSLVGAVSNSATRPEFGGDDGADVSTLYAYAVSPGHAFLRQGSANNKIQLAPGTLMQKIANAAGADSTLVMFTFAGTEEWSLTNGDATNPRVDLLEMKLEYINDTPASTDIQDAVSRALTTNLTAVTRRRIQCTLTVKVGTPAASPTIPDPDTGFVPVGTVVIGHGWTTGGNAPIFGIDSVDTANAVVHDQRMPIGVQVMRVDPVLYKLDTAWSLANVNTNVLSTNGTNKMQVMCAAHPARVIGVDIRILDNALAANAVTLGRLFGSLSAPGTIYQKCNGFGTGTAFAGAVARSLRTNFEAVHVPANGPTVQQSATNKIGVPLWTSGFRTPQTPASFTSPGIAAVGFINQTNATTIGEITYYLAGIG